MSLRPTAAQALARGAGVGAAFGIVAGAMVLGLTRAVVAAEALGWLLATLALTILVVIGATVGMAFGREEGVDLDQRGIHLVPAGLAARWQQITDLRVERRGARIVVAVQFDSGSTVRLQAPYDGRWLSSDPEFERKLFLLRNHWETHRSFTLESGFPTRPGAEGRVRPMVTEPTASEHRRVPLGPVPGSPRQRGAKRSVFVGWQVRSERGGSAG